MTETRKNKPYQFEIRLSEDLKIQECVFSVNPPPITAVTFKGGGARVFVYKAAAKKAREKNLFREVEEFSGSSSGTLSAIHQAIPFTDPERSEQMFEELYDLDAHDSIGDSLGWNIYKFVSSPFNLISKPFEWFSKGTKHVAKELNQRTFGKLLSIPLKFVSSLTSVASNLTSPQSWAALYNLMTTGGMYRGEAFEKGFQKIIHQYVEGFIDDEYLVSDQERREFIKHQLISKGIYTKTDDEFQLTTELTFNHFFELSKLFDGAFKEVMFCAVKLSDLQLAIFKKGKEYGDVPVYKAMRAAISLPLFYMSASINGEKFMDGGAIDNCPSRHASTSFEPTPFQKRFGITSDMSKLAIRVEYPNALDTFLWNPRKPTGSLHQIKASFLKLFTSGIDTYQTQKENEDFLEEKMFHRTLQMEDFRLKRYDFHLSRSVRADYLKKSNPRVDDFFEPRLNEKAVIINYKVSDEMTLEAQFSEHKSDVSKEWIKVMSIQEVQVRLLVDLEDKSIPIEELFWVGGNKHDNHAELAKLRENLITQLKECPAIKELKESPCDYLKRLDSDKSLSSAKILKRTFGQATFEFKEAFEASDEPNYLPQTPSLETRYHALVDEEAEQMDVERPRFISVS